MIETEKANAGHTGGSHWALGAGCSANVSQTPADMSWVSLGPAMYYVDPGHTGGRLFSPCGQTDELVAVSMVSHSSDHQLSDHRVGEKTRRARATYLLRSKGSEADPDL